MAHVGGMVAGHGGLKNINMGMYAYERYAQAWGKQSAWAYKVGLTLDINSYALVLKVGTAHVQAIPIHEIMPCLNLSKFRCFPYELILHVL